MNARQMELAVIDGGIANRHRLMTEAIVRGNPVEAGEQARWLALLGMQRMAERSQLQGWKAYMEVYNWWNGGRSGPQTDPVQKNGSEVRAPSRVDSLP